MILNLKTLILYLKKGNKSNIANYKPISLTPVVEKLLETFIRDQQSIEQQGTNNLIKNSQHDFRRRLFCLIK